MLCGEVVTRHGAVLKNREGGNGAVGGWSHAGGCRRRGGTTSAARGLRSTVVARAGSAERQRGHHRRGGARRNPTGGHQESLLVAGGVGEVLLVVRLIVADDGITQVLNQHLRAVINGNGRLFALALHRREHVNRLLPRAEEGREGPFVLLLDGGDLVGHLLLHNVTVVDNVNTVGHREEAELVGDNDAGLRFEEAADGIVEYLAPDGGVEGRERVVKDVNVRLAIERAGNRKALALSAGEGSTFSTDNRRVTVAEEGQVDGQG